MNHSFFAKTPSKQELYSQLHAHLSHFLSDERSMIANCANFSALLYGALADVNWCGFYLWNGKELVVGPFQGKPACVRIAFGQGVCGTSAAQSETIIVPDVHEFPGHIACDADSRSEIVVPILFNGEFYGVLDIDSPIVNRFSTEDKQGLELLLQKFCEHTDLYVVEHA